MASRAFIDMMGREVVVHEPPRRIISLVPSQTELLYDLGLDAEVVGITKFCIHPGEWFRSKKRVGGTKNVNMAAIAALQPDLVIANKEENTKEQIEALAALYPTWISDIQTVDGALQMITAVGELVSRSAKSAQMADEIQQRFAGLTKAAMLKRVAYFIWRKPWMCAGGDTFISDMIAHMGWVNVLADTMRYPEIDLASLANKNVDLVLLSSEPYPFKDAHIVEIKSALPGAEVQLVDGEMFSWYGSRLLHATQYLQELI